MLSFMIGSNKHRTARPADPFSKASAAAMRKAVSSEFSACDFASRDRDLQPRQRKTADRAAPLRTQIATPRPPQLASAGRNVVGRAEIRAPGLS